MSLPRGNLHKTEKIRKIPKYPVRNSSLESCQNRLKIVEKSSERSFARDEHCNVIYSSNFRAKQIRSEVPTF